MNILLTNDDGIKARGIEALKDALLEAGHKVIIVAPKNNQSGSSHRMHFYKKIRLSKLVETDNLLEYSLDGSPADCVKLAVTKLFKNQIDLVISGVNDVPNTGTDILYSGTFNGAFEGTFNGIKSIAISANNIDLTSSAVDFLMKNLDTFYNKFFDKNYTININVPDTLDNIKGVKICPVGEKKYTDLYEVFDTEDCNQKDYFLYGDEIFLPHNTTGCDVNMLNEGYITITPTRLEIVNNYEYCNKLKDIKLK